MITEFPGSLLRNSLGQRRRPNYAPILELWRHEPPNLSGFVKDHNSKIGAALSGLTREGSELRNRLPEPPKTSVIMPRLRVRDSHLMITDVPWCRNTLERP
ncbi:hypothetical protein GCM10010399_33730 [Dactylosporangium fulvum]